MQPYGEKNEEGLDFQTIQQAVTNGKAISFKYRNANEKLTTHNFVYPKKIFRQGKYWIFQAYCYFTRDMRIFRLDRVYDLRSSKKRETVGVTQQILEFLPALLILILVFIVLILFSPKYRWRQVREFLF